MLVYVVPRNNNNLFFTWFGLVTIVLIYDDGVLYIIHLNIRKLYIACIS